MELAFYPARCTGLEGPISRLRNTCWRSWLPSGSIASSAVNKLPKIAGVSQFHQYYRCYLFLELHVRSRLMSVSNHEIKHNGFRLNTNHIASLCRLLCYIPWMVLSVNLWNAVSPPVWTVLSTFFFLDKGADVFRCLKNPGPITLESECIIGSQKLLFFVSVSGCSLKCGSDVTHKGHKACRFVADRASSRFGSKQCKSEKGLSCVAFSSACTLVFMKLRISLVLHGLGWVYAFQKCILDCRRKLL